MKGFSVAQTGLITAIYPACWGIGQLFAGRLSDFISRKKLLFIGMLLQGITLLLFIHGSLYSHFIALSIILGIGKAMVYPTFIAAIADNSHPQQRAESVGIYRFFRDCGYAIGAFLSGILADFYGIGISVSCIGTLTLLSGLIIQIRMKPDNDLRY